MRRLAAAAVLLLVLAGCSSGDGLPSFDGASPTTAPAGAQAGSTGTPTSLRPGTGNAFCDFLQTYNDRFGKFNAGLTNPQELRAVLNDALAAIRDAEATAPPEIKADLTTMRTSFQAMVRSFEDVGYDVTKLRLETLQALQVPQFVTATQKMNDYTRRNCL